ncbi:hypothetical protein SKAU_G00107900 [Synaphobranchus kaupii]|uniref:Centrosome-associated FAM110 N-terminal domain-containing protein n=1 Tax=Synaphobranchus kaupii TaxID=118154 RepID=A0A9Q1G0J0_SYNKA|nr:hypothetical protein SKAU_G00107900 [Synaphobranchus kaupii]
MPVETLRPSDGRMAGAPFTSAMPFRILHKGPDYFRRAPEPGARKLSAVERLEADKAKYVKSQQVASTKQEPVKPPIIRKPLLSPSMLLQCRINSPPARKVPRRPGDSEGGFGGMHRGTPLNLEILNNLINVCDAPPSASKNKPPPRQPAAQRQLFLLLVPFFLSPQQAAARRPEPAPPSCPGARHQARGVRLAQHGDGPAGGRSAPGRGQEAPEDAAAASAAQTAGGSTAGSAPAAAAAASGPHPGLRPALRPASSPSPAVHARQPPAPAQHAAPRLPGLHPPLLHQLTQLAAGRLGVGSPAPLPAPLQIGPERPLLARHRRPGALLQLLRAGPGGGGRPGGGALRPRQLGHSVGVEAAQRQHPQLRVRRPVPAQPRRAGRGAPAGRASALRNLSHREERARHKVAVRHPAGARCPQRVQRVASPTPHPPSSPRSWNGLCGGKATRDFPSQLLFFCIYLLPVDVEKLKGVHFLLYS